jgi:hypothetical protein
VIRSARTEIEQYTKQAFAVTRYHLREPQAQRRAQALHLAALSGNPGTYVPAVTGCATEDVRESILALADAYVEAFTLLGVPSESWAESALRTLAEQIAGAAAVGAIGQIELHTARTRQPVSNRATGHIHREVGRSMLSALGEGTLRLKRQRITLETSLPVASERSEESGPSRTANSGAQGLHLHGPDDVALLIEPYVDGYVWQARNGSLKTITKIRFEIASVQSFDAQKGAFREPTGRFRAPWPVIYDLASGDLAKAVIFVTCENDRPRFGDTTDTNWLPLPSGDPEGARRWLLRLRVVGLSTDWPIELDLRWAVGTRTLELSQNNYTASTDGSESEEQSVAIEEIAVKQEGVVNLVPGQEYPKYMRHATLAPVSVNSLPEQAALGPDWSEVTASHYPSWRHHWTKKETIAQNAAADAALGGGWAGSSAAFELYRAPRPPRTDLQDPTRWVDNWAVSELAPRDRKLIKAQLLRAESAFWKSPDADSADLAAMKLAFDGIAKVLFAAGILTDQLLQDEIPILVWDSAIAGGWYRHASETPERIFPERLGHYHVWRDETKDWNRLFRAETAHWLAALLEVPEVTHETKACRASQKRQADAGLQNLKARVRQLRDEGLTHQAICDRLGNSPRPPRAAWRELAWPIAFRRHPAAVAKWLSDALR